MQNLNYLTSSNEGLAFVQDIVLRQKEQTVIVRIELTLRVVGRDKIAAVGLRWRMESLHFLSELPVRADVTVQKHWFPPA